MPSSDVEKGDSKADGPIRGRHASLYANDLLVPHETLIFIDEVQESPEKITAAKFLVEKMGESYDFIGGRMPVYLSHETAARAGE